MNKAQTAVQILKRYALEQGIHGRDTSDLSPLEQWLILRIVHNINELRVISEKLDDIDGTLLHLEDVMHNEEGMEITKARKMIAKTIFQIQDLFTYSDTI